MGIFDRLVGQLGDLIDRVGQIDEPDEVRLAVDRAEELERDGELDGAARELRRALGLKPDHARAALLLGRVELGRGEPDAAEAALREALAARPEYPEAQVLLGEALVARGDERGALEVLRRALDGGLSDSELRGAAWRSLGALHLAAGRTDKAVRELRKAVASLRADAEAHRLLGEALDARGDLDGARLCFERAVAALSPPSTDAPTTIAPAPGAAAAPHRADPGDTSGSSPSAGGDDGSAPGAAHRVTAPAVDASARGTAARGRGADAAIIDVEVISSDEHSPDAARGRGADAAIIDVEVISSDEPPPDSARVAGGSGGDGGGGEVISNHSVSRGGGGVVEVDVVSDGSGPGAGADVLDEGAAARSARRRAGDEIVDSQLVSSTDEPVANSDSTAAQARPLSAAQQARLGRLLFLLGDVERRLAHHAAARNALTRSAQLLPVPVEPLLALGALENALGDGGAALEHARAAVAVERSPRTLLAVARSLGGGALEVQAAYEEARAAGRTRAERAAVAREAMRHALRAVDDAGADEQAVAGAAARAANLALLDAAPPPRTSATTSDTQATTAPPTGGTATDGSTTSAARAPLASGASAAEIERSEILAANALSMLLGSPSAPPDPTRAAQAAASALTAAPSLEALLVHARVALAGGDREGAAASLRRALEVAPVGDPRPRRRLAALHRTAPLPGGPQDLYPLLRAAHARLLHAPETSDLAPEAARVVEILDRPLQVTVMGEFNAGKSTFVNALVGEEVAPMGIVPTTATINVLKYGAERGGRVVYRDDTVRAVPWSEVGPLLRALDEAEATRIRYVEVLYPLATLQRVNIVDTPGLNSIRPEHEATAREFIAQADAIIWLFSCRQPGTASERDALGRIREAHKKALGVVNQIDRLEGPEQVEEVLAFLRDNFSDLVEALVPFSAREALLGRTDPERLARSNRALLERTLDERFFDRAKAIQRAQAVRRLEALLDEAAKRGEVALASERQGAIQAARAKVEVARTRLGRFLAEERLACIGDLDSVYAQAAREVLDFARPRSWAFGANQAAPADRDFLIDLVAERLGALADASRRRVTEEAERAASEVLGPVLPRRVHPLADDELRLLGEQVYGRYRAFIRGFLRGGRVDDFFTRVLPRLELGEQSIRRALLRDLPALDVLEEELLDPLAAFAERFVNRLGVELDREAGDEELRRLEIAARLVDPVAELRGALARLISADRDGMEAPVEREADRI